MAALKIAFETPDNPANASPVGRRPIDFVELGKQTMGDKGLEIEVLQLFARQARRTMGELSDADTDGCGQSAHRLKGAALAVGATRVAEAAAAIERRPADWDLRAALGAAVLEAELFILKLCR
ncbi:Hpt domain-containing protein [Ensifer sp. BR816]|uniref:Hpt domain-containing protein n=1 Tax=Rhizobium sp. (strain BR816) TaxID=1057002 RepID=UPI00037313D6|nr:Hpt domain-containing protein [Ensifer sp. BR816]